MTDGEYNSCPAGRLLIIIQRGFFVIRSLIPVARHFGHRNRRFGL